MLCLMRMRVSLLCCTGRLELKGEALRYNPAIHILAGVIRRRSALGGRNTKDELNKMK